MIAFGFFACDLIWNIFFWLLAVALTKNQDYDHDYVATDNFYGERSDEESDHPRESMHGRVLVSSCSAGFFLSPTFVSSSEMLCVACPKGSFTSSFTASVCTLAPIGTCLIQCFCVEVECC